MPTLICSDAHLVEHKSRRHVHTSPTPVDVEGRRALNEEALS
jgi:hypothetical protein